MKCSHHLNKGKRGICMTHRIQEVVAKENFIIQATFFGGEIKQYDVKQLFLILPQFQVFQEQKTLFGNVVVDAGGYGISWNDELDLDAETIWEEGVLIEIQKKSDLNHLLAYHLLTAREHAQLTQKELAEKTGIYQADISKIERGLGNPSLSTLKRLADGLEMDLQINFVNKE